MIAVGGERSAVALQQSGLTFHLDVVPDVVLIQKRHQFAMTGLDAGVSGNGRPAVGLVYYPDAIPVAFEDFHAVVFGAVVDRDHFNLRVSLVERAVNALPQVRAAVINRDDNGNQRWSHRG